MLGVIYRSLVWRVGNSAARGHQRAKVRPRRMAEVFPVLLLHTFGQCWGEHGAREMGHAEESRSLPMGWVMPAWFNLMQVHSVKYTQYGTVSKSTHVLGLCTNLGLNPSTWYGTVPES